MAKAARPKDEDPNKLKRERAGRYVTPDNRFAVESNSTSSWYVVDNERQNELGLPLMDGPFATLDDARDAVVAARAGGKPEAPRDAEREPTASDETSGAASESHRPPLRAMAGGRDAQAETGRRQESAQPTADSTADVRPKAGGRTAPAGRDQPGSPRGRSTHADADNGAKRAPETDGGRAGDARPEKEASREPAWLERLSAAHQSDARRLLAILERLGIDDPALVRREIEADIPEVARVLLARRVQRDALEIWREPDSIGRALKAVPREVRRHLRPVVEPTADAAERVLAGKGTAGDLAAFAWLVAIRTAGAVFDAIDSEGLEDRVTGEPGWRLVELDGRREPTRRAISLDSSDLLEPTEG